MRNLDLIIKAYDVRGTYPDQLDETLAHEVGGAFVRAMRISARDGGPGAVVVAGAIEEAELARVLHLGRQGGEAEAAIAAAGQSDCTYLTSPTTGGLSGIAPLCTTPR